MKGRQSHTGNSVHGGWPSQRFDIPRQTISPHYPSPLRPASTFRARLPFPRAAAIYDRVARHTKPNFHPRAKRSRSNSPRFDFSKRGFCAPHPSKNTPQTDLGFRTRFARVSPVFCDSHPRAPVFDTDSRPAIRGENRNRRFPQSTCTWRATNPRRLKRSHQILHAGCDAWPASGQACPAMPGHPFNAPRPTISPKYPSPLRRIEWSIATSPFALCILSDDVLRRTHTH
jgi:hypothetical protein